MVNDKWKKEVLSRSLNTRK